MVTRDGQISVGAASQNRSNVRFEVFSRGCMRVADFTGESEDIKWTVSVP